MENLSDCTTREQVIKTIREFFYAQNFHEVITPVLNNAVPNEPNLHPFKTEWTIIKGEETFYLPMSPERNLKLMLAKGIGNCFSIGHSFRNLEQASSLHTPEFLMLEWYREKADYKIVMEDVKKLMAALGFSGNWQTFSLPELFGQYSKHDLEKLMDNDTNRANYDQIFCNEIETKLPKTPLFITDFPAKISPLCKPQKKNPFLAERFEFYINGIELGNGNTENTDYNSVRKIFEAQQKKNGLPVDEEFLKALKKMGESGKSYAGIGIGIDRLIIVLKNAYSIDRR